MHETIRKSTTLEELNRKHDIMMEAYHNYEVIGGDSFKRYYQTQLDIYRDTCVVIVERLMRENPTALLGVKLWQ